MFSTDINNFTLSELYDLFVKNTTELLRLMNQKGTDGYLLGERKADVEMIQSAIAKKKMEAGVGKYNYE